MRVARELDRLLGERGKPTTIVSDNGSELSSKAILCDGPTITRWPGTISRRGRAERLAESFIGHLRGELLNETLFRSLAHTRAVPSKIGSVRRHVSCDKAPGATAQNSIAVKGSMIP